jgi:uncharacterized protein (DUF1810 family)
MPGTDEKDPYNLQRFVDAQNPVFAQVCSELREGRKRTHWMWFIFPQLQGLGSSSMARRYAISSLEEATAYLKHPILGPRLTECARLVTRIEGRTIEEIFSDPDYLKFRSSMTLFARATSDNQVITSALDKYFEGEPDPLTLERL